MQHACCRKLLGVDVVYVSNSYCEWVINKDQD